MRKTILFLFLIFLGGCVSPEKSLQKQNYESAFKSAMNQLQRGKSVEKNKEILIDALDAILERKRKEKEKWLASNQLQQKEKAIPLLKDAQKKIETAFIILFL